MESKRIYWRQRNTVRWINLGATIAHKRNFIVSLTQSDGSLVMDHEQKANLLWTTFRSRLGISEFQNMAYDLSSLLTQHNLSHLDDDFSQDEIDSVIKNLPNSHTLGPDGFNGFFYQEMLEYYKG
jgi:hypothetical protein